MLFRSLLLLKIRDAPLEFVGRIRLATATGSEQDENYQGVDDFHADKDWGASYIRARFPQQKMTEWNIQPRSSACTQCQQPFADKAAYHALLLFSAEGYQRRDLCGTCFASSSREGATCYWQGEYKMPAPPPPEPLAKDTAETLLRQLLASPDPAQAPARYILAVMLERKKILKHRDTVRTEGGEEALVYEHAKTGESFTIPDPHLRLDQLTEVQQQVAALLAPSAAVVDTAPAGG